MYRVGIDLGGTNIAVGLVNENNEIIVKKSTPTKKERPIGEIVDDMAILCTEVCLERGVDIHNVASIGIASPGVANSTNGHLEYANNIKISKYPMTDEVAKRLGVASDKVKLANDANAAALGEAVAGAAKGSSSSIMVTLGTGVGGGIIIDKKIYTGFNFAGAELGHIVIETDGIQCTCGRRGCWEAYSSASALIRMTQEKIDECKKSGRNTLMSRSERVNGRTACDAMRKGDEAGKEVYDRYIKYLATGLVNIINIFQPEVISLGGGVSNEGQSLIDSLMPLVEKERYGGDNVNPQTELRIAKLGNDAGIIGAAAL